MKYFCLALATLFFGCISVNKTNQLTAQNENAHWKVTKEESYSDQEQVVITISNVSGETLIINDPLRLPIFKKEGDGWKVVDIQYCNCMPCPPPPDTREVGNDQTFRFKWDKMEETCSGNVLTKNAAKPGVYKLELRYALISSTTTDTLSVEFTL